MKRLLLLLAVVFSGCGSDPPLAAVEEGPSWCNLASSALAGDWVNTHVRRGHQYEGFLWVTAEDPCTFSFHSRIRIIEVDHDPRVMSERKGVLIVTGVEHTADFYSLTVETKVHFQGGYNADGEWEERFGTYIYDTGEAKIWGNTMLLWEFQFQAVEE